MRILSPTLGRPAILTPGQPLRISAQWPAGVTEVWCELTSLPPARASYVLRPASPPAELRPGETLEFAVPQGLPPEVYDLTVHTGRARLIAPHSVALMSGVAPTRIIHLSNMNVGDPSAPRFDAALADELNLLAPSVIVATGDYVDALHPEPARAWREFRQFCERLRAPLVLACGDHDDMEHYGAGVAPSPIGVVDAGRIRFLVLYDVPASPVHQDSDQLAWVERTLAGAAALEFTCIVGHDDSPNLLRHWQQAGTLGEMVRKGRIGLYFAGGGRAWDGREYRELIDAARPMRYVRTPSATGCQREGGDGRARYRVLDLRGTRLSEPGGADALQAGLLRAVCSGRNDGSEAHVAWDVWNAHGFALPGCELRAWVKKGAGQPHCSGGEIVEALDRGDHWELRIRFDLADKAGGRVAVSADGRPEPAVRPLYEGAGRIVLKRARSADGVEYFAADPATVIASLENTGPVAVDTSPRVRLDGATLAYRRQGDESEMFALLYRLRLEPGERIALEIDLSALRVSPGRRTVQVQFDESPPFAFPVELALSD